MTDYKQNEVVQELQMKDVLCTRNAADLYDQRDSKGQMSFSNPINIATATMEQIYERLCWVYAALRSTVNV